MAKRRTDVALSEGNLERISRPIGAFGGFDRLFDDFLGRRWPRFVGEAAAFEPYVDIIDREEEVVVRAELPGFKKEDVQVSVSGNRLTMSGRRTGEQKEKGTYYRAEMMRGFSFVRTLALPAEVNDAKATASIKDGILELTLPKVEKSTRRNIDIT